MMIRKTFPFPSKMYSHRGKGCVKARSANELEVMPPEKGFIKFILGHSLHFHLDDSCWSLFNFCRKSVHFLSSPSNEQNQITKSRAAILWQAVTTLRIASLIFHIRRTNIEISDTPSVLNWRRTDRR